MVRTLKSSAMVVTALWVGVLFTLGFILAPYLFTLSAQADPRVPHSGVAASLLGPLLYSSDVIGLIVGALLLVALIMLRRRGETPMGGRFFLSEIAIALAVIGAAVNYWVMTPRINHVQNELTSAYGAFHQADKSDPLYAQFTSLHGTSTMIFMAVFVAALVCLVCLTQFREKRTSA